MENLVQIVGIQIANRADETIPEIVVDQLSFLIVHVDLAGTQDLLQISIVHASRLSSR